MRQIASLRFAALWLFLFGIFFHFKQLDFLLTLLLDKVPFSQFWTAQHLQTLPRPTTCFVILISLVTSAGLFSTTRSQVREPRKSLFRVILLCALCLTSRIATDKEVGGEGCVVSMGDVGAVAQLHANDTWLTAKRHGLEPRQIPESTQTSKQRKVCKRSFIRARNRASLHGHTWYRGRFTLLNNWAFP